MTVNKINIFHCRYREKLLLVRRRVRVLVNLKNNQKKKKKERKVQVKKYNRTISQRPRLQTFIQVQRLWTTETMESEKSQMK